MAAAGLMMLGTEEPFSAAAAAVLPVSFLASVVTVSCMTKSCLVLPLFCFVVSTEVLVRKPNVFALKVSCSVL